MKNSTAEVLKHHNDDTTETLIEATCPWDTKKILEILENGIGPDTIVDWGFGHTLLHLAVSKNDQEVIDKLLKLGANLERNLKGKTPLDFAISLRKIRGKKYEETKKKLTAYQKSKQK